MKRESGKETESFRSTEKMFPTERRRENCCRKPWAESDRVSVGVESGGDIKTLQVGVEQDADGNRMIGVVFDVNHNIIAEWQNVEERCGCGKADV